MIRLELCKRHTLSIPNIIRASRPVAAAALAHPRPGRIDLPGVSHRYPHRLPSASLHNRGQLNVQSDPKLNTQSFIPRSRAEEQLEAPLRVYQLHSPRQSPPCLLADPQSDQGPQGHPLPVRLSFECCT
jgi:hypothetical protein